MKRTFFIAALMLGLALPAAADYTTIEQAYECALSEIRLPRSENGTIAYKECATCEYVRKQVDGDTRWLLNGRAVPLKKFREAIGDVEDSANTPVTVLKHLQRNRVTQVSVYL